MCILAIETTGAFASVALMKEGKILEGIKGSDRFSHLQNLMPQVETVIKNCKLSLDDITAIAVSKGPGSFTGIRIGISSARALSQVLHIPCMGISSLQALAMRAYNVTDSLICPILDARRGQVYGGGYIMREGFPVEEVKTGPYTIEEFMEAVKGYKRIFFMGDGVDTCMNKIQKLRPRGVEVAPEAMRYQDAKTVALLGERLFIREGGIDYEELKPDYMRLAEAERKLLERQQKA